MNSTTFPRRNITLTRLFAAVMIAWLALFASAAAANAHDELIGSTPESGSTVTAVPEEIVLNFSGVLQTLSGAEATVVVITDGAGEQIENDFTVDGRNVTITPATELSSGEYTVASRVVSSDGHPIEKTISFTVNAGEPVAPSQSSAVATDEASEAPSQASSAEPSEPAQEQGEATAAISPVIWIIVGIAILGVAVAVLVNFARRNNTK